ncbi:hypothetical protein WS68_00330 [Burkholderia sp. TSV86]|nr:hypothetical protein WS68_00330 [Burkholderia sp. TSV86]
MKRRAAERSPEAQRRVLLARMAATRTELSSSNRVIDMTRPISAGGNTAGYRAMTLPNLGGSAGVAIAVALVGCVVLGPRRLVMTAARAGLAALVGRMARDAVQK